MVKSVYKDIIAAGDCVITEKEILKIANLAKLEISNDEIPLYIDRIQNILSVIDGIDALPNDVDVADKGADFNLLREDNAKPSFESSDILSNAKDCENSYFKLRKKA